MIKREIQADMTAPTAHWAWRNDQESYDDWMNDLMRDAPESWDGDESAEWFVFAYVRHLERLVTAAYGPEGLERHHDGVESAITAFIEMNTIRDWIKDNLPHVRLDDGVAQPVIQLLATVKEAMPVLTNTFQNVAQAALSIGRSSGWVSPPHKIPDMPPKQLGKQSSHETDPIEPRRNDT